MDEDVTTPAQTEDEVAALDLKPAHLKRLRFIFAAGRPITVVKLTTTDLELLAADLVEIPARHRESCSGVGALAITNQGVLVLKRALDERRAVNGVHHSLGSRLAHWLRETRGRMTWENATFSRGYADRSAVDDLDGWTEVRLDVVSSAMTPTARLADLSTYEVKVSVADFMADMAKPKKVQASREIAQSAWYCTPMGLIKSEKVPEGFGLICEDGPGVFKVVKRAKRRKDFMPTPDTLMTLVLRRSKLPEAELY